MKKGTVYSIDQMRQFAKGKGFTLEQFGNIQIGGFFSIIKNDDGVCASFVLVRAFREMTYWECVYSEF